MERIIWKFGVPLTERFVLVMPAGAQVLTVQNQGDVAHVWVLVDPSGPRRARRFALYGTGRTLPNAPETGAYVGTFQTEGGQFVWHLFDLGEE
jgi:hypothetical protein